MSNTFIENFKPSKNTGKVDEEGNIIVGENIQLIIESSIVNIEE